MVVTVLMPCPECGADREHDVTTVIEDREGNLVGYTLHCRACEFVWEESA